MKPDEMAASIERVNRLWHALTAKLVDALKSEGKRAHREFVGAHPTSDEVREALDVRTRHNTEVIFQTHSANQDYQAVSNALARVVSFTETPTNPLPSVTALDERKKELARRAAERLHERKVSLNPLASNASDAKTATWAKSLVDAIGKAEAREQFLRGPSPVLQSLSDARSGRVSETPTLKLLDPSGKTFSVPAGHQPWLVVPRAGTQLVMPLENGFDGALGSLGVSVRSVFAPAAIRTYLGMWALAWEHADNGYFEFHPQHFARDMLGLPTLLHEGRAARVSPKSVRDVARHLEVFLHTYVQQMGDVKTAGGQWQALVLGVGGKHRYQHAPVAWEWARKNFVQVPRALVRAPADDVPLALGTATMIRSNASKILRGTGFYRTTLEIFALDAGEDVTKLKRDRGANRYFADLKERATKIVQSAELGELHITGDGPDAEVTLTPSDALGTVYETLLATIDAHERRRADAKREAEVRNLAPANAPRTKRPRQT